MGTFDMKWTKYNNLRIVKDLFGLGPRYTERVASAHHSSQLPCDVSYLGCRGHGGLGSSLMPHGRNHHSSSFLSCSVGLFQGSRGAVVGSSCL